MHVCMANLCKSSISILSWFNIAIVHMAHGLCTYPKCLQNASHILRGSPVAKQWVAYPIRNSGRDVGLQKHCSGSSSLVTWFEEANTTYSIIVYVWSFNTVIQKRWLFARLCTRLQDCSRLYQSSRDIIFFLAKVDILNIVLCVQPRCQSLNYKSLGYCNTLIHASAKIPNMVKVPKRYKRRICW